MSFDTVPYDEFKCHHAPDSLYDDNGVLTCLDCGATYIDIAAGVSFPAISKYQREEVVV